MAETSYRSHSNIPMPEIDDDEPMVVEETFTRLPRKLTVRRQVLILGYLHECNSDPSSYPRYGTLRWIKSMIEHMDQNSLFGTGLVPEDIKRWMAEEEFFKIETMMKQIHFTSRYDVLEDQFPYRRALDGNIFISRPHGVISTCEDLRSNPSNTTYVKADIDEPELQHIIKIEVDSSSGYPLKVEPRNEAMEVGSDLPLSAPPSGISKELCELQSIAFRMCDTLQIIRNLK